MGGILAVALCEVSLDDGAYADAPDAAWWGPVPSGASGAASRAVRVVRVAARRSRMRRG